jgi:nucleoside-diphosphate-sugar epimerase
LKNKNPQWIGKIDVLHSFTYSKDIGKSLAILGNTPEAYNQVWHLPTTDEKLTSRQWIELMMKEMNVQKKIRTIPTSMLGIIGLFVPILKELKDVSYQLDRDYFFNSSKFNKRFGFKPISSEEGIKEMIEYA